MSLQLKTAFAIALTMVVVGCSDPESEESEGTPPSTAPSSTLDEEVDRPLTLTELEEIAGGLPRADDPGDDTNGEVLAEPNLCEIDGCVKAWSVDSLVVRIWDDDGLAGRWNTAHRPLSYRPTPTVTVDFEGVDENQVVRWMFFCNEVSTYDRNTGNDCRALMPTPPELPGSSPPPTSQ